MIKAHKPIHSEQYIEAAVKDKKKPAHTSHRLNEEAPEEVQRKYCVVSVQVV